MSRFTEKLDDKNIVRYKDCAIADVFRPSFGRYAEGEAIDKLAEYEDLEESGLLVRLPVAVGSTVYRVCYKQTKCTEYEQEFDEYSCQGCEYLGCDSKKEWFIKEKQIKNLSDIVDFLFTPEQRLENKYFLTKEDAEKHLQSMKSE